MTPEDIADHVWIQTMTEFSEAYDEITKLKARLALTEKALELACRAASMGCPESGWDVNCMTMGTECHDCWREYFMEKAKEKS